MIDPHTHLRDWNQNNKETLKHGFKVAYRAGLDAVFEMPNTDFALTSRKKIEKRIELADKAIAELGIKFFHGIYAGITANPKQIEEVVETYKELFPRVVGLKMYAGHSVGNMGIIGEEKQKLVYWTLVKLNYQGVLMVHCEKESVMKYELWDPKRPITHTQVRPPQAEIESLKDQIKFAQKSEFKGTLHICHISTQETLEVIEENRDQVDFKITCGLTPHHALLNSEMMKEENGILLKINPPLRSRKTREKMLQALLNGRIDWIETDHSPHLLKEKTNPPHMSGFPVLPFWPHFIKFLKKRGFAEQEIDDITHNNIIKIFDINIENTKREGEYILSGEYEFNPFKKFE